MTAQLAGHATDQMPAEQPYLARRQNWTNQLARHALMQPGRPALRFLGHTTTWGDLDRRVNALANALHRLGVGVGDRVMILMLNRTEFVETFLAANVLGAIAVPVNFRLTPPEIALLVEDCEAHVVDHRTGAGGRGHRGLRHYADPGDGLSEECRPRMVSSVTRICSPSEWTATPPRRSSMSPMTTRR